MRFLDSRYKPGVADGAGNLTRRWFRIRAVPCPGRSPCSLAVQQRQHAVKHLVVHDRETRPACPHSRMKISEPAPGPRKQPPRSLTKNGCFVASGGQWPRKLPFRWEREYRNGCRALFGAGALEVSVPACPNPVLEKGTPCPHWSSVVKELKQVFQPPSRHPR